jgi:hypothetical protein
VGNVDSDGEIDGMNVGPWDGDAVGEILGVVEGIIEGTIVKRNGSFSNTFMPKFTSSGISR